MYVSYCIFEEFLHMHIRHTTPDTNWNPPMLRFGVHMHTSDKPLLTQNEIKPLQKIHQIAMFHHHRNCLTLSWWSIPFQLRDANWTIELYVHKIIACLHGTQCSMRTSQNWRLNYRRQPIAKYVNCFPRNENHTLQTTQELSKTAEWPYIQSILYATHGSFQFS